MPFYVCNLVELVSLPYSYFLCSDTSTSLSSQVFKERLAGTEEVKMCTVGYTVCQPWLCLWMCSCFYMIGLGLDLRGSIFAQSVWYSNSIITYYIIKYTLVYICNINSVTTCILENKNATFYKILQPQKVCPRII